MSLPDGTAIASATAFIDAAWAAMPIVPILFALSAVLVVAVFALIMAKKALPKVGR